MKKQKTKQPIAVIISDVHYSLSTLEVADKCLRQAVDKANYLEVPLIIAGDLHDSKANLRGECVKAMLDTIDLCSQKPYILVGNHDKTNEKSESHSLEFLRKIAYIIDKPQFGFHYYYGFYFVPYQHDLEEMCKILAQIPDGSKLIIHQGRAGALAGGYSFDKSALTAEDYAPFTVLSGHYHEHQQFTAKNGNTFTYIGNPYTLDFSEASHPDKGFLILNDDFTFERVLTNVRKHVVIELENKETYTNRPGDIVLVKAQCTKAQLAKITKDTVRAQVPGLEDFRLDLIPTPEAQEDLPELKKLNSAHRLYAYLVDESKDTSAEQKEALKTLWKKALE